jgi:hypothetical protein
VTARLGIGIIGSGFNARFHLQALVGVRDADVIGLWSPNPANAAAAAELARRLEVGPAKVYSSIAEMVADPAVHAIWLCGPNHARVESVEEIVDTLERGRGALAGIACEKPLARNVAEADRLTSLVKRAARLPGEPGLRAPGRSGTRAHLGARSATHRPALSRPCRGGAQRATHALVLAGESTGWRSVE